MMNSLYILAGIAFGERVLLQHFHILIMKIKRVLRHRQIPLTQWNRQIINLIEKICASVSITLVCSGR